MTLAPHIRTTPATLPGAGSHVRTRPGAHARTPSTDNARAHLRTNPRAVLNPVMASAALSTAAVVVLDVILTEHLSRFFDLTLIFIGFCTAFVVNRDGFFAATVLPPLLLGATAAALTILDPTTLTATPLTPVATWLTGLAHHATPLMTSQALVLATLTLRTAYHHRPPTHT